MSEEIRLSDAVRKAMESMSLVDDPLCRVDLDLTAYINTLFPTEQSLSHLDDTMETVCVIIVVKWDKIYIITYQIL
jgi:hypothetical protein